MSNHLHRPIIFSIEGSELSESERGFVQHPLAGGVILFTRNFKSREQITQLCTQIKQLNPALFISIDHEGGRVQRIREDGFTILPTMRSLGELYQTNPNSAWQACVAVGTVMAAELQACQIDLSFAPVLDLDYGSSAVIGNRSFSRDPNVVAYLASGIMYGMSLAGMSHCGKHFPGHGFVQADSHTEIPVDDRSYDEIERDDMKPYQALMTGLASVMPAHVIYPKVDAQPAGFSKVWLQDILRNKLKFAGSIFSDDLSMEGASIAGDYVARAKIALDAGCDYLLICNQPEATQLLFDQVKPDWVQSQPRRALHINQAQLSWSELNQWSLYTQAKIQINQL